MSKVLIIILVLVVLAGAVWFLMGNGLGTNLPFPSTSNKNPAVSTHDAQEAQVVGTDVPINTINNSNQLGEAIFKDNSGKVDVTVNIKGAVDNETVGIYAGTCASSKEVKFPLPALTNGSSSTTLQTTLPDLKSMGALAIHVYKYNTTTDVACGDVKL